MLLHDIDARARGALLLMSCIVHAAAGADGSWFYTPSNGCN